MLLPGENALSFKSHNSATDHSTKLDVPFEHVKFLLNCLNTSFIGEVVQTKQKCI
jgi:hypothetical protein